MTFTQLTTRLKNFLRGWLLVLGLKEDLVECKCATLCVKSEGIQLALGYSLALVHLITSLLVWAEIEVHVALPKQSIN